MHLCGEIKCSEQRRMKYILQPLNLYLNKVNVIITIVDRVRESNELAPEVVSSR